MEPHVPPPSTGHWHFPPSRAHTPRFTAAVTWSGLAGRGFLCGVSTPARRLACFSSSRSSAASITCSFVAPGWTCPCPRRAASSFTRNWLETVMWMRLSLAVSGSNPHRRRWRNHAPVRTGRRSFAAAPPVGVAVNATAVPKSCGVVAGTEASASAVTGAGTTTL